MKELHEFAESEEMYLKTIAEISRHGNLVPVTNIAERLRISTVSASEMVHRLQDRGLLEHTPYKGVRLTADGWDRADGILRRHRLWECFLVEHLELPWKRVHSFACQLEHVSEDALTDALDKYLGLPSFCPHGNPIPNSQEVTEVKVASPLSDLDVGQDGVVLCIREEDGEILEYLDARAVRPGSRVRIEEIAPYDGPRSILVDGEKQVLGRKVAEHILIELVHDNETE
ncbi:MAG: metal-dependent transcriptional regulator [Anaerolineales bacterium]|nr:metal-dependent transcriptional regulator [Anaerolineales bacterium]